MVNWKKFFAEEMEEQEEKKVRSNKKVSTKLKSWFESDEKKEYTLEDELRDLEIEYANTLKEIEKAAEREEAIKQEANRGFSKYSEDIETQSEAEMDDMIEEISKKEYRKAESRKIVNVEFLEKLKSYMREDEEIFEKYDKESKVAQYIGEEDDQAEDYKTYLDRIKNEDVDSEDEELEKEGFLSKARSKFGLLFDKNEDVEDEDEEYSDVEYSEEVDEQLNDEFIEEFDEDYKQDLENEEGNIDYIFEDVVDETEEEEILEEEKSLSEKLSEWEYHTEEEIENNDLKTSLESLGINVDDIKDVDLFEEREEERSRRVHPTLASVKVRRILQEREIDSLNYDLALEENKDRFVEDLQAAKNFEEEENSVVEDHVSKNQEDIDKLNQEFNTLSRKSEKITLGESVLREKNAEKIDGAIKQIRVVQKESEEDRRDYSIRVETNEDVERREKLAYTSVDDVLYGNDDLFENDIDKNLDFFDDSYTPSEIEDFRESVFKKKESSDLLSGRADSELDKLILDTKIVENKKEESQGEIEKLEENLALIKEYNRKKQEKLVEKEELTLEKVAKESQYNFENYEDFKTPEKQPVLYSDYELSQDEIDSLKVQSEIDYKSNIDIDNLNEEMGTKNNKSYDFNFEDTWKTSSKKVEQTEEVEEEIGIDYEEKLYTNDVGEYFVEDNAPLTFGEYKTQDRGYRPVSKEKIEENRRKLDAIFEKYSNITIPRRNTTAYVEQKLSTPVRVDKYKPSQVISAVYGTRTPNQQVTTKKEEVSPKEKVTTPNKKTSSTNYFEEIASQKEISWEIGSSARVPKKKNKK